MGSVFCNPVFGYCMVPYLLTSLRSFFSSPLGKACKRALLSLAASILKKRYPKDFRRYWRIAWAAVVKSPAAYFLGRE